MDHEPFDGQVVLKLGIAGPQMPSLARASLEAAVGEKFTCADGLQGGSAFCNLRCTTQRPNGSMKLYGCQNYGPFLGPQYNTAPSI